jgi:tetratricopeptide (TPR) repeat protein
LDKDQGSPDLMVDLGLAFLYAQQYTEAELKFREVLRKHPDHFPARWAFGELRLHQGLHLESQGDDSAAQDKYSEAIVELRRACKLDPQSPEAKAELAFCLGKLPSPANRSRARRIVNELHHRAGQNKPGERYVSFTALAVAQLGEGDRQNAMANLTKGVAAKEEWLIWLKVDPVFQALSSDDFKEIHDAIGLWSQTE